MGNVEVVDEVYEEAPTEDMCESETMSLRERMEGKRARQQKIKETREEFLENKIASCLHLQTAIFESNLASSDKIQAIELIGQIANKYETAKFGLR